MRTKINENMISIPPYISSTWANVAYLIVEESNQGKILVVTLIDGSKITVPQLTEIDIQMAFDMHAKFLETEIERPKDEKESIPPGKDFSPLKQIFSGLGNITEQIVGIPLKFSIDPGGLEQLSIAIQHNPELAKAPDLPSEVLNKISAVAKMLGLEENQTSLKPEPHCNCPHCQILRAMGHTESDSTLVSEEEEVSDADLKFSQWQIMPINDKLYQVFNPSETTEAYQVYLGEPIGCTCGKKNCEHLKAVLES